MDLDKVLSELRRQLEDLDAAIQSLERLQKTDNRRGRPPSWLTPVKKRGRPPGRGKVQSKDGNKAD